MMTNLKISEYYYRIIRAEGSNSWDTNFVWAAANILSPVISSALVALVMTFAEHGWAVAMPCQLFVPIAAT